MDCKQKVLPNITSTVKDRIEQGRYINLGWNSRKRGTKERNLEDIKEVNYLRKEQMKLSSLMMIRSNGNLVNKVTTIRFHYLLFTD